MQCEQAETCLAQLAAGDSVSGGDGDATLIEAAAHVETCETCREKLADYRLTLKLLADGFAREAEQSGPVPTLSADRRAKLEARFNAPPQIVAASAAVVEQPNRFNIRNYLRPLGVAASFGLVALGAWGLMNTIQGQPAFGPVAYEDSAAETPVTTLIDSTGSLATPDDYDRPGDVDKWLSAKAPRSNNGADLGVYHERVAQLEAEKSRLYAELGDKDATIQRQQAEAVRLQAQGADYATNVARLSTSLDQYSKINDMLEAEVVERREKQIDAEKKLIETNDALRTRTTEVETLVSQTRLFKEQVEDLSTINQELPSADNQYWSLKGNKDLGGNAVDNFALDGSKRRSLGYITDGKDAPAADASDDFDGDGADLAVTRRVDSTLAGEYKNSPSNPDGLSALDRLERTVEDDEAGAFGGGQGLAQGQGQSTGGNFGWTGKKADAERGIALGSDGDEAHGLPGGGGAGGKLVVGGEAAAKGRADDNKPASSSSTRNGRPPVVSIRGGHSGPVSPSATPDPIAPATPAPPAPKVAPPVVNQPQLADSPDASRGPATPAVPGQSRPGSDWKSSVAEKPADTPDLPAEPDPESAPAPAPGNITKELADRRAPSAKPKPTAPAKPDPDAVRISGIATGVTFSQESEPAAPTDPAKGPLADPRDLADAIEDAEDSGIGGDSTRWDRGRPASGESAQAGNRGKYENANGGLDPVEEQLKQVAEKSEELQKREGELSLYEKDSKSRRDNGRQLEKKQQEILRKTAELNERLDLRERAQAANDAPSDTGAHVDDELRQVTDARDAARRQKELLVEGQGLGASHRSVRLAERQLEAYDRELDKLTHAREAKGKSKSGQIESIDFENAPSFDLVDAGDIDSRRKRTAESLSETESRLEKLTTEAAAGGRVKIVSEGEKPIKPFKEGFLGLTDDTYRSTGVVRIEPTMPKLIYSLEHNSQLPIFESFVESQVEFMRSQRVLEAAMKSDEVKKLGDKAPADADALAEKLKIQHPERSELIIVSAEDADPEVATALTRAVTNAYNKIYVEQGLNQAADRLNQLETRRTKLRDELQQLDQRKRLLAEQEAADAESDPLPAASNFKSLPVNPFVMTERDRFSTFGIDTDSASYALARKYVRAGFRPPAGAIRMEEFVNAFDYNYANQSGRVFTVHAEAGDAPYGENLTLVKVGVKAKTIGRENRKPAHLVFVIDASGSMDRPDRLPLVKHSLALLVSQLGPTDRVTIVAYGTKPIAVVEAVPASHKDKLRNAINSVQAGGSTNMIDALGMGYDFARNHFKPGEINRVIVCSDGVANVGATEAQRMLDKVAANRTQGITLTNIGFGIGGYNDALMTDLAKKGDGNYVFVDTTAEAKRLFVDQLASTLQTVAKDAKIQVEFDPARVRRYRLIGYEARDIADKDFRNDTVDAGEVGSGQSATALYEVELLPAAASDNAVELADLGTVFVRYKNVDTGEVEEISSRLRTDLIRKRTPEGDPRFYLAACAAEYAEVLRGSVHARGASIEAIERKLIPIVQRLPLDRQAAELLDLVRRTKGLPAAP